VVESDIIMAASSLSSAHPQISCSTRVTFVARRFPAFVVTTTGELT
jgi:hypothetical protein